MYCKPEVVRAMQRIWNMSGNGTTGIEATFILSGTPDNFTIEYEPMTHEQGQQHIYLNANTFAVFHVHPNNSGKYPSTPANNYAHNGKGDTGMADANRLDVYVVHRDGLTVYRSSTKVTVSLRDNMSWTSTKGCF